ncbi:MAG: hypothetical protein IJR95_05235 [Lachnospiraceae bacterium]|nr:hypothetical protein [Lachnospiraceae bacterium]
MKAAMTSPFLSLLFLDTTDSWSCACFFWAVVQMPRITGHYGKLKPGKYRLVLFVMAGDRYKACFAEGFDVGS